MAPRGRDAGKRRSGCIDSRASAQFCLPGLLRSSLGICTSGHASGPVASDVRGLLLITRPSELIVDCRPNRLRNYSRCFPPEKSTASCWAFQITAHMAPVRGRIEVWPGGLGSSKCAASSAPTFAGYAASRSRRVHAAHSASRRAPAMPVGPVWISLHVSRRYPPALPPGRSAICVATPCAGPQGAGAARRTARWRQRDAEKRGSSGDFSRAAGRAGRRQVRPDALFAARCGFAACRD